MLTRDEDVLAAARIVARSRARRRDRDRGRDLGLGAEAGRLASRDRRRGKFSRLGFGRLRRGRGRRGGARRDRRTARRGCWSSASPTRRPGASAFPAAAASRSMSRSSPDAARYPQGDEFGASRAARRRDRHASRRRRAAIRRGRGDRRRSARRRAGGAPCAWARAPPVSVDGEELFSHRAGARAAAHPDRRRAYLAGAGADRPDRRPRRLDHRSAHRLRDAGALSRHAGRRAMAGRSARRGAARPLYRDLPPDPRSQDRRPRAWSIALQGRVFLHWRARLAEDARQAARADARAKASTKRRWRAFMRRSGSTSARSARPKSPSRSSARSSAALRKKPLRAESAAA